jgi:hypothetical protein
MAGSEKDGSGSMVVAATDERWPDVETGHVTNDASTIPATAPAVAPNLAPAVAISTRVSITHIPRS